MGFAVFFVFSLGLGLPYLFLAAFSGVFERLPKSGEWMVWVRKIFGVLLVGFALYYLEVAFFPQLLPFLVPVVLLGGGIYLGFLERSGNKNKIFLNSKRLVGVLACGAAAFLLFWHSGPRVSWEPYTPERLIQAQNEEKPVIMDFYADWCISCHELERFTYSHPGVIRSLDPFVRLKADLTRPNTGEAQSLIERFDILGVPTILFLDSNGNEIPDSRIPGFVSAEDFLKIVQSLQVVLEGKKSEA
jgi:thiol:disulfide interchange protein DsbD